VQNQWSIVSAANVTQLVSHLLLLWLLLIVLIFSIIADTCLFNWTRRSMMYFDCVSIRCYIYTIGAIYLYKQVGSNTFCLWLYYQIDSNNVSKRKRYYCLYRLTLWLMYCVSFFVLLLKAWIPKEVITCCLPLCM
jgi:hypothetical protein